MVNAKLGMTGGLNDWGLLNKEWKMTSLLKPTTFARLLLLGVSMAPTAWAGQPPAQMPTWEPDLVPSGAIVGECYARVQIPAQYSTRTESVLVEEGYSRVEISQPQLASRQEQVMTKEASVRYVVRQPRYKTISERIMVRPAYDKLSVSPPQFRTVTETIQTLAARLIWKRGNPGRLQAQGYRVHSTADDRVRNYSGGRRSQFTSQFPATHCGATCEIWCLVEEPGESISFNRKVMTSPGQVRRLPVPAKYTSVSKQVVAEPGSVREIPIPAEYRSITVEGVVNHGSERMVNIPAKYGRVDKRTLVHSKRYEWRRVVCRPGTLRQSTIWQSGQSNYRSGGATSAKTYGARQTTTHRSTTYNSGTHQTGTHNSGKTYYYGTNKPVH